MWLDINALHTKFQKQLGCLSLSAGGSTVVTIPNTSVGYISTTEDLSTLFLQAASAKSFSASVHFIKVFVTEPVIIFSNLFREYQTGRLPVFKQEQPLSELNCFRKEEFKYSRVQYTPLICTKVTMKSVKQLYANMTVGSL